MIASCLGCQCWQPSCNPDTQDLSIRLQRAGNLTDWITPGTPTTPWACGNIQHGRNFCPFKCLSRDFMRSHRPLWIMLSSLKWWYSCVWQQEKIWRKHVLLSVTTVLTDFVISQIQQNKVRLWAYSKSLFVATSMIPKLLDLLQSATRGQTNETYFLAHWFLCLVLSLQ